LRASGSELLALVAPYFVMKAGHVPHIPFTGQATRS
jgi:hypothetical protein